MAVNAASNLAQKVMGDVPTSITASHASEERKATGSEQMLALTWQGKEKVVLKSVPKPEIMDEEDVVIKVTGSTVCGSDLHLLHGDILQLKADDILGHEGMGVVEAVGSKVKNRKVGDRVVVSFSISCGTCKFCKEGLGSMCEKTNSSSVMQALYGQRFSALMGYSHFAGGLAGLQSEYARIPYADNNTIKIPPGVSDEKALYLSDIVCTSYHSVVDVGFQAGQNAVVFGAGPVGLNIVQWLLAVFGAKRVVLLDSVQNRLDFAKEHFAGKYPLEVVNIETDCEGGNVVKKLYEMEELGWDVAFDVAGFRYAKSLLHKAMRAAALETDSPETLNEAIMAVRKFGRISIAADYAGLANGFNIGALMEKGIMLKGNGQAPVQKYMQKILDDYIIPGKFDPTLILTHRFDITEMDKLYYAFDQKRFDQEKGVGILKCFVQTKHSNEPAPGMPTLTKVP